MKDSLKLAFALKPLAKLVASAIGPRSAPAQASMPDSYEARVSAHTTALVALMDATAALGRYVGVKTSAAIEEHAKSLTYLRTLANAGGIAPSTNRYWSERKASARTRPASPGQSIHHRILSRTGNSTIESV